MQRFKHRLCLSEVRSLARLLSVPMHAPGAGCRNNPLHPEYVIKHSLGQEKAGVLGAEGTRSGTELFLS